MLLNPNVFLRRLDEACQLLHGVGQLLYEVHLLTASGGVEGGHKFSWPYDLLPLQPALIL